MAGPTVGLTGVVTSWGSDTEFTYELVKDLMRPNEFSLNMNNADLDTTPFTGPTVYGSALPGLREWSGSIAGFLGTSGTPASDGIGGLVATAEYDLLVRSWEITLTADALDVTNWTDLSARWKGYAPGIVRWSGTYEAIIDNATHIGIPAAAAGAATFTLSSGNSWAGNIFTTQIGAAVRVGDVNVARFAFRGTGDVTFTGSNAGVRAGALATPEAESLVLTAYSGRTYTGNAFWTSIRTTCNIGDAIKTSVDFRGTGALTPA
jgi:hypothetical protein